LIRTRSVTLGLVALGLMLTGAMTGVQAQTATDDPIVAKVGDDVIRLSDVKDAANGMPHSSKTVSDATLYPMILDQMIDGKALSAEAHRTGLDKDPAVQRQMSEAAEAALQTALLKQQIQPLISDQALHARYDQEMVGRQGSTQIHARHILVDDEATAKKIIAELKKGGDFAALSKKFSKDPGASKQGGDLGFFGQHDMVPEFSKAAFTLKDGEISSEPVHTQFGWHVIQVIERKQEPPPSFEQVQNELRQRLIQDGIQKVVGDARAKLSIEKFNLDGSVPKATDMAEPPHAK
jgi:peptidyl-prolyl cis-trans isomerase C